MRKIVLAVATVAATFLPSRESFADDDNSCPLASLSEPELCPVGAAIGSMVENLGDVAQQIGEFRSRSAAAGAEIARFRRAFYEELDSGVRGGQAEQEFSQVLLEKDVYYMSLYAAGGMLFGKQDVERVDKLGGRPIDGGIDPHASTMFGEWVSAIRQRLGAQNNEFIFFPSPLKFREAFEASQAEYQAYKLVRDKYELRQWQMSRRPKLPKATTREEMADQYIESIVAPVLRDHLDLTQGSAKQEAEQTALDWIAKLRRVIVDYELVELTTDNVVAVLRAYGGYYTDQDIASFLHQVGDTTKLDQQQREARFAAAVGRIIQAHDHARGSFSVVNEDMIALDLRTRAYAQTTGKLSESEAEAVAKDPKYKNFHDRLWYYTSGPGHEVKFGVTPYANVRPYIVSGNMRGDPPPIPGAPKSREAQLSPQLAAALFPLATPKAAKAGREAEKREAADAAARATQEAQEAQEADEQARREEQSRREEEAKKDAKVAALAREAEQRKQAGETVLATGRALLGGGAYGFDIVGVRLGMPLDEADRVARASMQVCWVLENPAPMDEPGYFTRMKVFVRCDNAEKLGLLLPPLGEPQVVVGVRRKITLPPRADNDQLDKMLRAKYGPPGLVGENPPSESWGAIEDLCRPIATLPAELRLIEGELPQYPDSFRLTYPELFGIRMSWTGKPDWSRFANCVSRVDAFSNGKELYISLTDFRLYAALFGQPQATAGQQFPPPVKF